MIAPCILRPLSAAADLQEWPYRTGLIPFALCIFSNQSRPFTLALFSLHGLPSFDGLNSFRKEWQLCCPALCVSTMFDMPSSLERKQILTYTTSFWHIYCPCSPHSQHCQGNILPLSFLHQLISTLAFGPTPSLYSIDRVTYSCTYYLLMTSTLANHYSYLSTRLARAR